MKRILIWSLLLATALPLLVSQPVNAQVSRSAVLFLRIPQGARAIAMGRSNVAIAEDATATFWNPAGLGSAPLADRWEAIDVPVQFRPMTEVVARQLSARKDDDFELWAIGNNRLVRYQNGKWNDREVIVTKTSDQFDQVIAKYVSVEDAAIRDQIIRRITEANNRVAYESMISVRDSIRNSVSGQAGMEGVASWTDSIEVLWQGCRLNADAFARLRTEFESGVADGSLTADEGKRLGDALARCRNSFVPEEIVVPFQAITGSTIKTLNANSRMVLVVAETGVLSFVGNGWRVLSGAAGGISATSTINDVAVAGGSFFVATSDGLLVIDGSDVDSSANSKGLPRGAVTYVGGASTSNMFAVVDNDLYRFDGMVWTNTSEFLVPIDASNEKIAARFSPYGTAQDRQLYQSKLAGQQTSSAPDSAAAGSTSGNSGSFVPGSVMTIPTLSKVRGEVYDVIEAFGSIFVATEFGLMRRNDEGWRLMGYDSASFSQSLDSLALLCGGIRGESIEGYRARIMAINDLTLEMTPDQRPIWIPMRAASGPVTRIQRVEGKLLFTTGSGVFEYDGVNFTRATLEGLGQEEIVTAIPAGRDIWYASRNQTVTSIPGSSDLTISYVKWLPNLASDLYFLPLSAAINLGSVGTLGISITTISYGVIQRTNEQGLPIGEFNSYDAALTLSYGRSITRTIKGGLSWKFIQSRLSEQGAGQEQGKGDAFGWAFDFGGLWEPSDVVAVGATVTNIGPKMAYIDAAQADPLPANLTLGVALYPLRWNKSHLLLTVESDVQLIGLKFTDALSNSADKVGMEFLYEDLFALRGGYYNDNLGKVNFLTVGVGLRPVKQFGIDLAYVIDNEDQPLSGTFPISVNFRL